MKRTFNKSHSNWKYRIRAKRKMTNTSFTDGFCAVQKDFNTTIKTMSVSNKGFLATLEQMDLLINNTKDKEEILSINEVVLANYQEFILE